MAKENPQQFLHSCECSTCQQHPQSALAREHRRINRLLARITGLDRHTIARGQHELQRLGRLQSGAQAPDAPALKKSPELLTTLEELLRDATAGDPISGLKWTHRSLRKIQKALRRRGHKLALATMPGCCVS